MRFETSENLQIRIKDISKYRQITREEEIELALRIRANPQDIDAIHRLTVANLKFVIKLANKFIGQNVSIDDLISEGNLGLIEAATRYNPDTKNKNAKFITYAQFWIRKALNGAIANYSKIVRLPMNKEYDIYKRKMAGETVNTHTVELDRPIREGSEDTIGDVLLRVDPMVEMDREHTVHQVKVLMSRLTAEEKNVVVLKFGLDGDDPHTNKEIAEISQLSVPLVGRLIRSAKTKMKEIAHVV